MGAVLKGRGLRKVESRCSERYQRTSTRERCRGGGPVSLASLSVPSSPPASGPLTSGPTCFPPPLCPPPPALLSGASRRHRTVPAPTAVRTHSPVPALTRSVGSRERHPPTCRARPGLGPCSRLLLTAPPQTTPRTSRSCWFTSSGHQLGVARHSKWGLPNSTLSSLPAISLSPPSSHRDVSELSLPFRSHIDKLKNNHVIMSMGAEKAFDIFQQNAKSNIKTPS